FRTNNVDHCARLCHSSSVVALSETLGSGAMTGSVADLDVADAIFVIGANPTEQHPLIGSRILNAVRRGATLLVTDNRRIRLAHHADLHLRQRNGSDVALLNAMAHVVIAEKLADTGFIAARCENFDAFATAVAAWTPERAAAVTGLTAEEIVAAARLFAAASNAVIVYAMGITQHSHGVDNVRAVANLALLTGNLGRQGCGVFPLRGQNNVQGGCDMGALPEVYSGYQQVADQAVRERFARAWGVGALPARPGLPLTHAMNAAASGTLRGMFVMGENPLLSDPDQAHARAALERLDFLVVQEIFLSETAALADVVLPAACYAEKDGTVTNTERRVQRLRRAVAPPGAALADWEILCRLARAAGAPGWDYPDPAAIMGEIAALTPSYAGIDYRRLDAGPGLQWPCLASDHPGTPTLHVEHFPRGRARFAPVDYRPPLEATDADYPFVLTTGRTYFHWHTGTMTRRTHLLDREEREPFVEIHPDDAAHLQIRPREPLLVSSRRGAITVAAQITDVVPPGIVFIPFH
ncbi:MAG TPA: molybdopterin-dependent oxidoreductase, partial [Candidatus Eisenbacteria bacterium]|nr:molybdopterin-dependent oxidoreductase [Candidatus Eisenbacteria bacterium]